MRNEIEQSLFLVNRRETELLLLSELRVRLLLTSELSAKLFSLNNSWTELLLLSELKTELLLTSELSWSYFISFERDIFFLSIEIIDLDWRLTTMIKTEEERQDENIVFKIDINDVMMKSWQTHDDEILI